jgi:hypothetical protein
VEDHNQFRFHANEPKEKLIFLLVQKKRIFAQLMVQFFTPDQIACPERTGGMGHPTSQLE